MAAFTLLSVSLQATAGTAQSTPKLTITSASGQSIVLGLPGEIAPSWSLECSTNLVDWEPAGIVTDLIAARPEGACLEASRTSLFYRIVETRSPGAADLERHRRHWQLLGQVDYEFRFASDRHAVMGLPTPVIVSVRDNRVASLRTIPDEAPVDPALRDHYRTLDELFDDVADAVESQPDSISLTHDDYLGYIRSAHIDPDAEVADDEWSFDAGDFQPLLGWAGFVKVPSVQVTNQSPDELRGAPAELSQPEVKRNTLSLLVAYSGGCNPHDFQLFMSPATFDNSFPVQANLYVNHDSHGDDPCRGHYTRRLTFSLLPLAELYLRQYDCLGTILLNIDDRFVVAYHPD